MLSTELTHLKDEPHLKAFLERVNVPHSIPKGSPEEKKFKQSVQERLEQRALDTKQFSDKTIRSGAGSFIDPNSCCSSSHCCCYYRVKKGGGGGADPEIVWRRIECRDLDSFESYAAISVNTNLNIIRCLKAVNDSLSLNPEPHSPKHPWEGLSILGSYGWILTFSLQHLMDEDNPKDPVLLEGLQKIKELYTEMAQSSELFHEMVETFYEHSCRLRSDALYVVKKLVKKWKLEDLNPFQKRPEKSRPPGRDPIRRTGPLEKDLEPASFHLNWTPLKVLLRSKRMNIGWKDYGELILVERLHWFRVFLQRAVDKVQLDAEDMRHIVGQLSDICVAERAAAIIPPNNGHPHAREISGALIQFSKLAKYPMSKNGGGGGEGGEQEAPYWSKLIADVWYSADILHEHAFILRRLVNETRDILRTCYCYTDVFYKMGLPSYDEFLKGGGGRKSRAAGGKGVKGFKKGEQGTIRGAWEKFVSKDMKKLSDIAEMLVMADFSTSIYQKVCEVRPVEAEDMMMKLDAHNLDDKLASGLVSGMRVKSKPKNNPN